MLWQAFLRGHTPTAATRAALVAYVQGADAKPNIAARLPGLVNLIVSAPEYQLA